MSYIVGIPIKFSVGFFSLNFKISINIHEYGIK